MSFDNVYIGEVIKDKKKKNISMHLKFWVHIEITNRKEFSCDLSIFIIMKVHVGQYCAQFKD